MGGGTAVAELLDRELALANELEAVLRQERDAVTSFASADLERCVRYKGTIHKQLVALVEQRRQAVSRLGEEVGVDAHEGRLSALFGSLRPEMAGSLRERLALVREALMRTRRMQRVNGAIIDASLRFVGAVVDACRQLHPATRYDERAAVRLGQDPGTVSRQA